MTNLETIIRLQSAVEPQISREGVKINKLASSIDAKDFIRLLHNADNKVNPRSAKKNPITEGIQETLEATPELLWLKSKGILLASENCKFLERNRIRLSFGKPDYEGIMDGGHNALAIASYIAQKLFDRKFQTWAECKEFWDGNFEAIVTEFDAKVDEFRAFSIPVEILYPNDEEGAIVDYYEYIAEICSARNNNVQLREEAKGNKIGLYDELKKVLGSKFSVIWKTGEAGTIKADEVISMATIPLSFLQENDLLPDDVPQFNIIDTYRAKSKCVSFYNSVLSNSNISRKEPGKHILEDTYVESGFGLLSGILTFFDKVYAEFPSMYNAVSPGFGRIKSVDDKRNKLSIFRTRTCDYNYPPGFIYPLVSGVMELMEVDSEKKRIKWKVDPMSIDLMKLDMNQYYGAIKISNFDPQTVGKQILFYQQARSMFDAYLREQLSQKTMSA